MAWPTDVDMASIGRTLLVDPATGLPWSATGIPIIRNKTALSALGPTGNMVGAVSTQAVASNGLRTGLIMTNVNGSLSVFLAVATTAALNTGIALTPNGTWSMGEYDFTQSQINAIGSASGPILAIQQFA